MVLTVGLLCSVIGGTTWQKKNFKLYGYVYLWLKLLFGWLKNMQSHASCCSFISSGSGGCNHLLESIFLFLSWVECSTVYRSVVRPAHLVKMCIPIPKSMIALPAAYPFLQSV